MHNNQDLKEALKSAAAAILKSGGFPPPDWLGKEGIDADAWMAFEKNRTVALERLCEKANQIEIPPNLSLGNFANCVADVYATLLHLQAGSDKKLLQAIIHHRVLTSVNRAYIEYMSQWTLSAIGKAISFADEMGKGFALMSNEDIFWTAVHIATERALEDSAARAHAAIFRDHSMMGGRQLGEVPPEVAARMVHGLSNAKLPKPLQLMKVVTSYLKAAARVFGITLPQPVAAPIVTFTATQSAPKAAPALSKEKTPPKPPGALPPGLTY